MGASPSYRVIPLAPALFAVSIFRIEDRRIAEEWPLPDIGSMQQQLTGAGDE